MSAGQPECIFCRIVAGEIPGARVYEDELVLAFLDIFPLAPGHTLVIPKRHHVQATDVPAATMAALGAAIGKVARGVMAVTGAEGFNLLQANGACAGQEVPHAHFHVIPRRPKDGLGFRWRSGRYAEGELDAWRTKIASAVC